MLNKLLLVFRTVRYMTPRQIRYRIYNAIRNRFRSGTPEKAPSDLRPRKTPTA